MLLCILFFTYFFINLIQVEEEYLHKPWKIARRIENWVPAIGIEYFYIILRYNPIKKDDETLSLIIIHPFYYGRQKYAWLMHEPRRAIEPVDE